MEITIEDEKSVNGSVVNRGTISMYKKVRSKKNMLHSYTVVRNIRTLLCS